MTKDDQRWSKIFIFKMYHETPEKYLHCYRVYKSPLLCYGRFGSHLCEKQERNVVKKYVLLKQRRTGKICANLPPPKVKVVRDKMAMAQFHKKMWQFFLRISFTPFMACSLSWADILLLWSCTVMTNWKCTLAFLLFYSIIKQNKEKNCFD